MMNTKTFEVLKTNGALHGAYTATRELAVQLALMHGDGSDNEHLREMRLLLKELATSIDELIDQQT